VLSPPILCWVSKRAKFDLATPKLKDVFCVEKGFGIRTSSLFEICRWSHGLCWLVHAKKNGRNPLERVLITLLRNLCTSPETTSPSSTRQSWRFWPTCSARSVLKWGRVACTSVTCCMLSSCSVIFVILTLRKVLFFKKLFATSIKNKSWACHITQNWSMSSF
jgi:hypothetical protein